MTTLVLVLVRRRDRVTVDGGDSRIAVLVIVVVTS